MQLRRNRLIGTGLFGERSLKAAVKKMRKIVNAHDPAGAIEDLTRAVGLAPRDAVAWGNLAAARLNGGDLASAARDAERAVEIDPGYAKAWAAVLPRR